MTWRILIIFLFKFRVPNCGYFFFISHPHSSSIAWYINLLLQFRPRNANVYRHSITTLVFRCMLYLDLFSITIPSTEFECLSPFHIHLCLQWHAISWMVSCFSSVWMLITTSHPPSSSMAWCILVIFMFQFRPRNVHAYLHFTFTFVVNGMVYFDCFPVPIPCTECRCLSSFHSHLCLQWPGVSWLFWCANSVHGT